MKIRKIKFRQHPVLGNLELDLANPHTDIPYDTIVLAGENGTGKTSVLSTLNTFLCLDKFESIERIEYEDHLPSCSIAPPMAFSPNATPTTSPSGPKS